MPVPSDSLRAFVSNYQPLLGLLKSKGIMSDDEADAVVHALCDIAESIEKVYVEFVPALLESAGADGKFLKERLWDIREEFRQIDYHIHDAKLTDL